MTVLKDLRSRSEMEWADGKLLKDCFDKRILSILGPKTKEDEDAIREAKANKKKLRKNKVVLCIDCLLLC